MTVSFNRFTTEDAPENSRPALNRLKQSVGAIPNLAATMAGSPALIEGFVTLREINNQHSSFSPLERELLFLTNAAANDCSYCKAIHSMFGRKAGLSEETIFAIHTEAPVPDPRQDALVKFARSVVKNKGHIQPADLQAFMTAGFEKRHVLDIVACLAQSILANYTNHIAKVELDGFLRS